MKRIIFALLLGLCAKTAWAVPTLVQCTSFQNSGTLTDTSILSWPAPTTTDNVVFIVPLNGNVLGNGTLSSVTDDSGMNTYAVDVQFSAVAATVHGAVASGKVVAAATVAELHFTDTAVHNYPQWKACEFSGINTTSWFDKSGTGTADSQPLTVTASGQNAVADTLIFVIGYPPQDTPSGYTELWKDATILGGEAAYKIVSACETSSASWTTNIIAGSTGAIATYKGSGSASCTATTPAGQMMLMGVGK